MNLARHAAVLWRFRVVTAAGLLLGIVLAVLASYQVSWSGGPLLEARGTETWSSESSLLVTQPGFPEGRVILPSPVDDAAQDAEAERPKAAGQEQEFADPGRFTVLADLYSQLAVSDQVLSRVPEKPKPTQIQAMTIQSASGMLTLPVIKLTTMAATAEKARTLNVHMVEALRGLLEDEQAKNAIPDRHRVQLSLLNSPSKPFLLSGPSKTASILAFLLCLIGVIAVTHMLEALRIRRQAKTFGEVVAPWALTADDAALDGDQRSIPAPK